MNGNKAPKGQIEVTFYDNTKIAATIYHKAENVVLCWTNSGGVPLEHPVHPKNNNHIYGWVRELSRVFGKRSKTYNYRSFANNPTS